MANLLGKDARLYLDDIDIYLRSFEMEWGLEARIEESTKYGDDWQTHELIHGSGRVTVNAHMDDVYSQGDPGSAVNNALDLALWKMMTNDDSPTTIKSTPAVMTMLPIITPVVGSDGAIFSQGWGQFGIAPARSGLVALRAQIQNTGPINRGKILALGNITVDSGDKHEGVEVSFADPVGFTRASFHCFTITGQAATFTVAIESDETGFGGPTVRITFPTFTTMASGYAELVGTNTDSFLRATIASSSGTPSTLGIVVIGHTS